MEKYQEDEELTRYVWNNYASLLTQLERLGEKAIFESEKASFASGNRMVEMLHSRFSSKDDLDVIAALSEGVEEFRRKVRQRILRDHADQVIINRCPCCASVVRTPRARQCLWCGQSWHQRQCDNNDT